MIETEKLALVVIGPILAGLLVALLSKYAPSDPQPSSDSSETKYRHPILIKVGASFVVFSWLSMAIFMLSLGLGATGIIKDSQFILYPLGTFFVSALLYAAVAISLRCENCARRITVQWRMEPPPFSIKFCKMEGWSSIILQVLLKNRFVCMHCGKKYSVS